MKKLLFISLIQLQTISYSQNNNISDECPVHLSNPAEEERIKHFKPLSEIHNAEASMMPLFKTAFTYNYYYGTLHTHTAYSDGDMDGVCPTFGSAATCVFQKGDIALNFHYQGIADHNHTGTAMTLTKYNSGVSECNAFNASPAGAGFVGLYGMEWGVISTGGHVIVHGVDKLLGWQTPNYNIYVGQSDYNRLFKVVDSLDGFCTLAHPNQTDFSNIFTTAPYNSMWDSVIVGSSLLNGPYNSTVINYTDPSTSFPDENRWQDLLKKGYWVGPIIDGDNHNSNTMGRTHQSRTVVLANSLSKAAIRSAFKSRRFYASEDFNVQVSFDANNAFIMGSKTTQSVNPVLHVNVTDPDGGDNVSQIEIYYGVPGSGSLPTLLTSVNSVSNYTYTHNIAASTSNYYYYAKITQSDGHRIWTAPVWYNKNTALGIQPSVNSKGGYTLMNGNEKGTIYVYGNFSMNQKTELTILDLNGKNISFIPELNSEFVKISDLHEGTYILKIESKNGTHAFKFLVY